MFNRKEREGSPESEYRIYNGSCGSRSSSVGGEPQHVAPDRVRFAKDTSHYWYKPNISRDDGLYSLLFNSTNYLKLRESPQIQKIIFLNRFYWESKLRLPHQTPIVLTARPPRSSSSFTRPCHSSCYRRKIRKETQEIDDY